MRPLLGKSTAEPLQAFTTGWLASFKCHQVSIHEQLKNNHRILLKFQGLRGRSRGKPKLGRNRILIFNTNWPLGQILWEMCLVFCGWRIHQGILSLWPYYKTTVRGLLCPISLLPSVPNIIGLWSDLRNSTNVSTFPPPLPKCHSFYTLLNLFPYWYNNFTMKFFISLSLTIAVSLGIRALALPVPVQHNPRVDGFHEVDWKREA